MGCDGFNVRREKPAKIIFVAHLSDRVVYHYRGLIKNKKLKMYIS